MTYVIKLDNLYLNFEGIGEPLPTIGFNPIKFKTKQDALDTAIVLNKLNAYTNSKSVFEVYEFTEKKVASEPSPKHEVDVEIEE